MDVMPTQPPFVIPPEAATGLAEVRALLNNQKQDAIRRCEALIRQARAERQPAVLVAAAELYGLVVPEYGRSTLYEALQYCQAYNWQRAEARLCEQIARSFYTTGQYRPARQYWQQALHLASETDGEVETRVYAEVGLGQVHDALGDHAAAVSSHQLALTLALEAGLEDPYLLAKIRINLAVNLLACGQDDEAHRALTAALAGCRAAQLLDYAAEALSRLGEIALRAGELNTARQHFSEALQITRLIDYYWAQTSLLHQLSLLAAASGDLLQALELNREGMGLAELIGYQHLRMQMLEESASYAEQRGDLPAALQHLQQLLRLRSQQTNTAASTEGDTLADRERQLLDLASHELVEHGDCTAALQLLLEQACLLFGCSGGSLWLIQEQDALLCQLRHASTAPAQLPWHEGAALLHFLQRRTHLNAPLAREHPLTEPLLGQWHGAPPQSLLIAPVSDGSASWLIWLERGENRQYWLPDDETLFARFGELVRRVLQRRRQQILGAELAEINQALQQDNQALAVHVAQRGAALQQALTQLAHSERLATTGRLMAGMAHELNTPLGIAVTAASTLASSLAELSGLIRHGRPGREDVLQELSQQAAAASLCASNVQRAADLVQRYRTLSGLQDQESAVISSVHDVLQGVIQLYREPLEQRGHQVQLVADPALRWCLKPAALQQALAQLLGNVIEHTFPAPRTGLVTLAAHEGGGRLRLQLRDNGVGMPAAAVRYAFDPFYLRQLGSGGGLGLYSAYNLITAVMGGEISLSSEAGQFLQIDITLPG
ncbi:ATP-binding protein [Chitinilyticum piscinae]|uniref:histidine kinase n=1 Tax=Chitinilyticum piscinae TaxID=2866724 RepID=A0A8J7FVI5_9NEIS|nr:ATP-binding protein [Chitinilyticum piscinae]MBE9607940.1 hypothetical protein [Chitinilyticum piscinae]